VEIIEGRILYLQALEPLEEFPEIRELGAHRMGHLHVESLDLIIRATVVADRPGVAVPEIDRRHSRLPANSAHRLQSGNTLED